MATTTVFMQNFLPEFLVAIGKSTAGFFWQIVTMLWSKYWYWILLVLAVIVIYEILTRSGKWHYNSRNGFSPGFNRLVGSGVFALYSAIFLAFFHFVFGDSIYLEQVWPYFVHALAFPLTWVTLIKMGFWVY